MLATLPRSIGERNIRVLFGLWDDEGAPLARLRTFVDDPLQDVEVRSGSRWHSFGRSPTAR